MKAYILLLSLCLVQFSLSKTEKRIEFLSFWNVGCKAENGAYQFHLYAETVNMENGEIIKIPLKYPDYITAECKFLSNYDPIQCKIDTKRFAIVNETLEFDKDPNKIYQDDGSELLITGWENISDTPIGENIQCYYPYDYQLELLLDKGIKKNCLSGNQQELIFSGAYTNVDPTSETSLKSTERYKIKPFLRVGDEKLDWAQADCTIIPEDTTESNSSETPCTVKCTLTEAKKAQFINTVVDWDSAEENSSENYVFIPTSQKFDIPICKSSFLKFSAFLLISLLL